jgi:hypothetical protein
MIWKTIRGRKYLYESYRDGGRVRTRYIASGPAADVLWAAQALADSHERRQVLQARLACEQFRADAAAFSIHAYVERVDVLVQVAMTAAGYHQHARGEWRRRRMSETKPPAMPARTGPGGVPYQTFRTESEIPTTEAILEWQRAASRGDATAAAQIRDLLRYDPDGVLAAVFGGDLVRRIEQTLVARIAGENLATRASLEFELERMTHELAGPTPTPMERMLVDRVVTCWLHTHHYELLHLREGQCMAPAVLEALRRQMARSHGQLLSALKALATVRRMALPALQVNVGAQQVIVGSRTRRPRKRASAAANLPRPTTAVSEHGVSTAGAQNDTPDRSQARRQTW